MISKGDFVLLLSVGTALTAMAQTPSAAMEPPSVSFTCDFEPGLVPAAGGGTQKGKSTWLYLRENELEAEGCDGCDQSSKEPAWEGPLRIIDRKTKRECTIHDGLIAEIYLPPEQNVALISAYSGSKTWFRAYALKNCQAISPRIPTTGGKWLSDICDRLKESGAIRPAASSSASD